ncbi:universal stress protein [Arthrobacter sp. Br18]|uniref:universal stress protein n=1 Tax=Arthrobacter sp. Br18 TaxID=1312954 RepID=UPI00047B3152|nr:universal stress protein [Arthrobacter sp. Br18]
MTQQPDNSAPVVVGYDGSEVSEAAVRWAARYAARSKLKLVIVHCWLWPLMTHDLGPVNGVADSGLKHAAVTTLAQGRRTALTEAPGLPIETRLEVGYPSEILTRASAHAALVVTGSRGLGGFFGLLIGSASLHLVASAHCPVAIIRDAAAVSGPVVVAVDGSAFSRKSLTFACSLALALASPLRIVHAVPRPKSGPKLPAPAEEGQRIVDEAAAVARAAGLEEGLEVRLPEGRSVPEMLLHEVAGTQCLVLGSKGVSGLAARLGSTAHAVLHHSKGNVIVWRGTATD